MNKVPVKARFLGRLAIGTAWSPDFKWEVVQDNGNIHHEYVGIKVVQRQELRFLELTLGPIFMSFSVLPRG